MPKYGNLQTKKKCCVWEANKQVHFVAQFSLFITEQLKAMLIQTGFIIISVFTATPKQIRDGKLLQFFVETAARFFTEI